MKFDICINNKGFPCLGVEKEVKGTNHRWLFMPSDTIPKEFEKNIEFLNKYNEIFTKEVKEKYLAYLESLKPSLQEQKKQSLSLRKEKIFDLLTQIDLKSIRAIRENNELLINQFENEAKDLRIELIQINKDLNDI